MIFKSVNFRLIASKLVPTFIRSESVLALVYSAVAGVQYVNSLFVIYAADIRRKLRTNGQTIYLELYLNTFFSIQYDPATRAADIIAGNIIYIQDGANIDREFIFRRSEIKAPLYIRLRSEAAPLYLRRISEEAPKQDFILNIPAAVTYYEPAVRALVDEFRIAGKRYILQSY